MMGIASAFALRATADKSIHLSYALDRPLSRTTTTECGVLSPPELRLPLFHEGLSAFAKIL
jgi:hypothetical protein